MEKYSLMREFADSWFLLAMFSFFVAVVIWVFRPGGKPLQKEAAGIPFKHENEPAVDDTDVVTARDNIKETRQ